MMTSGRGSAQFCCFGLETGGVIIWISGKDAYDKHSGTNLFLNMDPIEE